MRRFLDKYKWHICWLCYLVVVASLVTLRGRCCFYDEFWMQTVIYLLTVAAMILVMLQNNDHIMHQTTRQIDEMNKGTQKQIGVIESSTMKQIEVLVEQFKSVVTELRRTCDILTEIHKLNAEQLERHKKLVEAEEALRLQREREEEERYRPRIQVRIRIERAWLFQHLYIDVYNSGGDSKNIVIETAFFSPRMHSTLARQEQYPFDYGRIFYFPMPVPDKIEMKVLLRDMRDIKYAGEASINKDNNRWCPVLLNKVFG